MADAQAPAARAAHPARPAPSPRAVALKRFLRHRLAVTGFALVLLLGVIAIFAGSIAPADPYRIDLRAPRTPPSSAHALGTDMVGRDVLSRLICGSRVSLTVGLVAVGLYMAIGVTLGAVAGYYGGALDAAIMRVGDMILAFPTLILVMVTVSLVGPSIWNIMAVLGFLGWPQVARLARGLILTLRRQEYVLAAVTSGASDGRVLVRHILPNTAGPLMVAATFGVANALLTEAALSFLGMGVQPPTPSWGNMLFDAQSLNALENMPWIWVPPGVMILLTALAINFLGDGLRDALDPRSSLL